MSQGAATLESSSTESDALPDADPNDSGQAKAASAATATPGGGDRPASRATRGKTKETDKTIRQQTGEREKTAESISSDLAQERLGTAKSSKSSNLPPVHEPHEADWKDQGLKSRQRYLKQVHIDYFAVVSDYLAYANMSVQHYTSLSKFHRRWRKWTIIATGGLAGLNALAAFELIGKLEVNSVRIASIVSAAAAIYAVGLTISGNLENFFNAGEKAAGFRESRELFLNRYREHLFKWVQYVEAFGFSPRACVNAGRLYHELIEHDKELRSKIKDLTEVKSRGGGEPAHGTKG